MCLTVCSIWCFELALEIAGLDCGVAERMKGSMAAALTLAGVLLPSCGLQFATGTGGTFERKIFITGLQRVERDIALALSQIPVYKKEEESILIEVQTVKTSSQNLSWGGGARVVEVLLSLRLDYFVYRSVIAGDYVEESAHQGNLWQCERSVNYLPDETRPLATERQRAQLEVAMVRSCAGEMLDTARRLAVQEEL